MPIKLNQAFATFLFVIVISWSKDNHTPSPSNMQDPKSKLEILTAKTWIVQEAYDLQGDVLSKYKRGSSYNTHNLDNDELTFYKDNTGTYKDATGQTYNLTWDFTNNDSTNMSLLIKYPTPVALNYDMVNLFDNNFVVTHNYINGSGTKVLATFHRIQK